MIKTKIYFPYKEANITMY